MHAYDARLLRGTAIPTGLAGLVAVVAGLLLAGGKGALGSAVGTAVVLLFFTISVLVVSYVSKISPQLLLMAALLSYAVKLVAVLSLVTLLNDVTLWNTKAFAWTVIALTVTWLAAETGTAIQAKVPHVEPASTAKKTAGRGSS